jgi:predicted NBD/HSP70 family sugar kinase
VILQLLRQHGAMSRADLARRSGLTEGSISRITSGLIAHKLVCEDGAEASTGGRPGTRLRLDDRRVGIGVEIRRAETRIAAVTLSGKIIDEVDVETPSAPSDALPKIAGRIRDLVERIGRRHIEGIGVSAGGIVDRRRGVVEVGSLPSWIGVPVKEILQTALKTTVQVENNVRLAAVAEFHFCNLVEIRNSQSLLFVMVDEGIGTGIVLGGELYSGPGHAAGEFGQMVISDGGDAAKVDRAGCLEKLASCTALWDRYARLTGKHRQTAGNHTASRVRKICQRALRGEGAARQALEQTWRWLSIGLANMIWGLNPDAVVIDSPMNEAWPLLASYLRSQFPDEKEIANFRHLVVRPSSLAGEATLIGAGTLSFQHLFESGDLGRLGALRK